MVAMGSRVRMVAVKRPSSAGCFHLSLEPEPLADYVCQARQNFAKVAARLLLQKHRRGEEPDIQQRNPCC